MKQHGKLNGLWIVALVSSMVLSQGAVPSKSNVLRNTPIVRITSNELPHGLRYVNSIMGVTLIPPIVVTHDMQVVAVMLSSSTITNNSQQSLVKCPVTSMSTPPSLASPTTNGKRELTITYLVKSSLPAAELYHMYRAIYGRSPQWKDEISWREAGVRQQNGETFYHFISRNVVELPSIDVTIRDRPEQGDARLAGETFKAKSIVNISVSLSQKQVGSYQDNNYGAIDFPIPVALR